MVMAATVTFYSLAIETKITRTLPAFSESGEALVLSSIFERKRYSATPAHMAR